MKENYGDFILRRLNKAGIVCLSIMLGLIVLLAVFDALWATGIMDLPYILRPQFQVLYFLWFIFVIVCLGIDKVSIGENGYVVSTLFTKKEETEKTALAYVLENDGKLFFVPIASSLGLMTPINFKTLKKVNGVLVISARHKDKVIERGYSISPNI